MQEIIKYVMGEAAKSNVEKRQVGCVITNHGDIIAKGYNTEEVHAEAMACEELRQVQSNWSKEDFKNSSLMLWVSHTPCPECAQLCSAYAINSVEVVEAFMKFDGDKLRYDLIDGEFAAKLYSRKPNWGPSPDVGRTARDWLWAYGSQPKPDNLIGCIDELILKYGSASALEDAIVEVLTFGARKYKANNWKKCSDTGRYLAAAHRHAKATEENDEESGLSHMAHLATNIMFLYVLGLKYD